MAGEEKRIHPRLQVSTEVRASTPKGFVTGRLRDVSKGGVGIFFDERVGQSGETIELFLPFPGGVEITVMCETLRITETPEGILYGLRFSLVEPSMQESLSNLMETLLMGSGGKTRQFPRVAKRLPIHYNGNTELKAILQTISLGGLSMIVETPLVLYEEVEVSIPESSGRELLILPARVVYQHHSEKEGVQSYQVGLQFQELTASEQACLRELLRCVVDEVSSEE